MKYQKYTSTEAKDESTEEQCKNIEKRIMSGNSNAAYNTLKALTKDPTA